MIVHEVCLHLVFAVLASLPVAAMGWRTIRGDGRARTAPVADPPPVLGRVPGFELTERSGKPLRGRDLQGQVWVADFIFTGAWLIGGVLLWRRHALGYVGGMGLLLQASMLFIGLLAVLIIQPFLSGALFVLTDVIVIFVMGFIFFIPFALFIRGTISS